VGKVTTPSFTSLRKRLDYVRRGTPCANEAGMRSISILLLVSLVAAVEARGLAWRRVSDASPDAAVAVTPGPSAASRRGARGGRVVVRAALRRRGMSSGDGGAPVLRSAGSRTVSNSEADLAALSAGIGWWYNWSPAPDSTLPEGYVPPVEFVPMIWGGTFNTTTLATQIPAGAK